MGLLKNIFVWWDGATIGTALWTWRKGVKVGADDQGNLYYRSKDGDRRWVIYNGEAEASRVPPEWHRWLHHTTDVPPSEQSPLTKPWEKPHQPNLSGTAGAYFPQGSLHRAAKRASGTGDYEAWRPE